MRRKTGLGLALVVWGATATTFIGSTQAADLYKARVTTPAAYNWTGWYAGLNTGYGWSNAAAQFTGDNGAGTTVLWCAFDPMCDPSASHAQSLDPSGFVGGGQIGYNWQFAPNWVAGLEADIQYSGIEGDALLTQPDFGGVTLSAGSSQELKWFGTVRARLGVLITDRLLAFATGGLAYGETKASAAITNVSGINWLLASPLSPTQLLCPANAVCLAGSSSKVSAGWTAGAGFEYAPWNNVSIKIEYLHVDLGDQTLRLAAQSPASGNGYMTATFDNSYDIVRAGVNFKY